MGAALRTDLAVPDGEFDFTWVDFRTIAKLVHGEAGIVLPESKAALVYSRLSKRLRELRLSSFSDYCGLIDDSADERQVLIAAMTTNVTRFFRESHHFEHLRHSVYPVLIDKARQGVRIRLWSAACSSGEEPYSIALSLLHAMPDATDHDILILASDLDPNMIAIGQAGIYPASRLEDIPPHFRKGAIEGTGDRFRFTERVRRLVRFRHLNLLREWPIHGSFHVIFCRNVMIYFDQPTQDAIWPRFANVMVPGGHLYIGHSERLVTDGFSLVSQTAYRRSGL